MPYLYIPERKNHEVPLSFSVSREVKTENEPMNFRRFIKPYSNKFVANKKKRDFDIKYEKKTYSCMYVEWARALKLFKSAASHYSPAEQQNGIFFHK